MARLISIPFLLCFLFANLGQATSAELVGKWVYEKFRYQGSIYPRPNPDLILTYEFGADGRSHLFWTWKNDPSFCDRVGVFSSDENFISDIVTWVNPNNSPACASDPDMKIGSTSRTAYRVKDDSFELDLNLGNEVMTYIWVRARDAGPR